MDLLSEVLKWTQTEMQYKVKEFGSQVFLFKG